MPDTAQDSVLEIKDKAQKPRGLMPKNLQAMVVFGIAILMILIMALTGRKPPKSVTATPPAAPTPLPVNEDKVSDYKKAIEEQQRQSAPGIERALLAQQQRDLAAQAQNPANPMGTPVTGPYPNGTYPPGAYAAAQPGSAQPPPPDPVKEEQKKRHYLSLFASNVALTYRKNAPGMHSAPEQTPDNLSSAAQPSSVAPGESGAPNPFLAQDQFLAQEGAQLAREEQVVQQAQSQGLLPQLQSTRPQSTTGAAATRQPQNQAADPPQNQVAAESTEEKTANPGAPGSSNSAEGKQYVLFEGTIIESLLINRLDGSFAGPVDCLVTNPVYSHDHQHLLIPAGSKLLGGADKVDTFGQARLAVAFHRLIMPDGYSVSLDQFKGLDQAGATALKDKVNNHYLKIFGASLAIGVLGAASELGTGTVITENSTDLLRQGFGYGLAISGERILDRFLNILPTVTIREGARVKVYLSNDLLLPDYNSHKMPPNL